VATAALIAVRRLGYVPFSAAIRRYRRCVTVVECLAVRWVSDDQPGFVEVELTDAGGTIWRLVDKVPVFGDPSLTPEGPYPRRVLVACEVVGEAQDDRVEVVLRHGVETADGTGRFWVRLPAVHSG
jgi:hypothetical protein